MAKPLVNRREVRIIIKRGTRIDLKAVIDAYIPSENRFHEMGMLSGPKQDDIDRDVRKMKQQFERAGHWVNVLER